MVPNKKLEDLIRFFHAGTTRSSTRDPGCCSWARTAGSSDMPRRSTTCHGHVRQPSRPLRRARCRTEELVAFYEIADLFLCASEHEGFCVPLVEAFYKQVPVLAYAAAAVPATMDGAGVLYHEKDPVRRRRR